jgi:hypothetical protein
MPGRVQLLVRRRLHTPFEPRRIVANSVRSLKFTANALRPSDKPPIDLAPHRVDWDFLLLEFSEDRRTQGLDLRCLRLAFPGECRPLFNKVSSPARIPIRRMIIVGAKLCYLRREESKPKAWLIVWTALPCRTRECYFRRTLSQPRASDTVTAGTIEHLSIFVNGRIIIRVARRLQRCCSLADLPVDV